MKRGVRFHNKNMHAANKSLRSVFLLQATAFDTSVQGFFNKDLLLVFLQFRIYLSESEPARDFTCLRSSRLPTLSKIVASRVKNATSLHLLLYLTIQLWLSYSPKIFERAFSSKWCHLQKHPSASMSTTHPSLHPPSGARCNRPQHVRTSTLKMPMTRY